MWPVGGCFFAETPDRPVSDARLFWRADWDSSVVAVDAVPSSSGDADSFDIGRFADRVTLLRHPDGHESVLFSDGARHLQFEIVSGTVMAGPVRLHYRLSGFYSIEIQTLSIRRLAQFCRLGRFPLTLCPPERRAQRWIEMLRAWDGVQAGAKQRDIAAALYGDRAAQSLWDDGYRTRVQRLIRAAEGMVGGGYLDLLRREEEGKGGPGAGRP